MAGGLLYGTCPWAESRGPEVECTAKPMGEEGSQVDNGEKRIEHGAGEMAPTLAMILGLAMPLAVGPKGREPERMRRIALEMRFRNDVAQPEDALAGAFGDS